MKPHLWIAAQMYATTAVQTGFNFLCIQYCFIRHSFGQDNKNCAEIFLINWQCTNIFNIWIMKIWNLLKDNAETETEVAEKSSWGPGKQRGKTWFGLEKKKEN